MNSQNERDFPAVRPFIEAMNIVITDNELDYLLNIGTGIYSFQEASAFSTLSNDKFYDMFESLKDKGFIKTEFNDKRDEVYTLNPIVIGWLEAQVPFFKG